MKIAQSYLLDTFSFTLSLAVCFFVFPEPPHQRARYFLLFTVLHSVIHLSVPVAQASSGALTVSLRRKENTKTKKKKLPAWAKKNVQTREFANTRTSLLGAIFHSAIFVFSMARSPEVLPLLSARCIILHGSTPTIISLRLESRRRGSSKKNPRGLTGPTMQGALCLLYSLLFIFLLHLRSDLLAHPTVGFSTKNRRNHSLACNLVPIDGSFFLSLFLRLDTIPRCARQLV